MFPRRVVVTGLGLVTPLATGVKASWKKLINSESGIISLKSSQTPNNNKHYKNNSIYLPYYEKEKGVFNELSSTIAGVIKPGKYEDGGFDTNEWLDRGVIIRKKKERKKTIY
jgi:3-oxoacyl-[acyl-carrier-protein] synthase II